MQNITLVSSMVNRGGTENATKRTALLLKKYGHEVHLISSNGPMVQELMDAGVSFSEVDLYHKNPVKLIKSFIKLIKVINKSQANIINCQMARPVPFVWLASKFQSFPIRVIWHSRGLHARTYPVVCRLFSFMGVLAIANCKHEKNKLIEHGYLDNFVTYSYNPIPENFLQNTGDKKKRSEGQLITLGSLSRLEKGRSVEKAIYIFNIINKKNRNTRLLIAGNGSELDNLKKLVRSYDLVQSVKFLGEVSDVEAFFTKIDILINTISLVGDNGAGVGNNIIEAGLYNKPVVSFDSCGISEFVLNEVTGFCVKVGDYNAFISKVRILINDCEKREYLANNLHSHIMENCSDSKIYNNLIKAYEA